MALGRDDVVRIRRMSDDELLAEWSRRPRRIEESDGKLSLDWFTAIRGEMFTRMDTRPKQQARQR